jgi:D-glycero-D-manno-heptose 1,7-bisphosphate phosphatase
MAWQPLPDPGLYRRHREAFEPRRAAVFLDRDGVLVEEVGYLHKPQDIRLMERAPGAMARLTSWGVPAVVVTNQAGIGRGYYGWTEFEMVQDALTEMLHPHGFHGVWACAYHPEAGIGALCREHDWRKPNPGMLLDAAAVLDIDLERSWLIGDKIIDLECAINARLGGAVLVRTGYGAGMEERLGELARSECQIHAADDVGEAVELIGRRIA